MKDILEVCKNNTYEQLLEKQLEEMSESNREQKYLKAILKEEIGRGNLFYVLNKKAQNVNKEYFQWTQCNNPDYNKYYKKLLNDLVINIENYSKVYELLFDEKSKKIFENICRWRLTRRSDYLVDAFYSSGRVQYFEEFENIHEKEIFVDCGAYDGDSFRAFINYVGSVEKAYLYDADTTNITNAKLKLKNYENVLYRNVGVGSKEETLFFQNQGLSSSSFGNQENGTEMKIVTIDDDISEKITFLKMDIEGMEMEALKGAKRHIQEDRPILAICLYHNTEDLWEIPLYIKSLVGDSYRYHIGHYTLYHGETVFYAVPVERFN